MDIPTETLLLSTKLKIPTPRRNYIVRKALFEKMSRCAEMSVVFVRGGAGTGKTTLLSTFIRETGLKNVCWLTLDASNVNAYSFWLYFTAAVSALLEDGQSLLKLVGANPNASNLDGVLTLLANRLSGDENIYIVLDDVHRMNDVAQLKTFEFFLNAMPPNFHLFMLSREDPPVYLGTMAVSGRLLYIDGQQMLLSEGESMSFLKETLRLNESEEALERLNAYAEGWIGGLQLAAAAGAASGNSLFLLRAGGGIATEYLNREIMEALSPCERTFLLKTGILTYFDARLCSTLIDGFSEADFQRTIDSLILRNLFIICVDEQAGVYRYHNILADYLSRQFEAQTEMERRALAARAAAAVEQRGDFEEALRILLLVGDYEGILRIARGMGDRIESWSYLDQVPLGLLANEPWLAVQCFLYNVGNLNLKRCRALYDELLIKAGDSDAVRILQFAEPYLKQADGILPDYHIIEQEVIERLPVGSVTKAMMMVENATALIEKMRYTEAEEAAKRAMLLGANTNVFVAFFATMGLAQIYEEQGRLAESLRCYEQSTGLLRTPSITAGLAVNYYFGLAGVYLRQMELEKAEQTLQEAETLMRGNHIQTDLTDMTAVFHRAEILFLRGEDAAATSAVASILVDYAGFHLLTLGRLLQEMICAGKLPDELAQRTLRELEETERYSAQPFWRMLRARILFERRETEPAMQEVDEILKFSRLKHNRLRLVEADLLKLWMLSGRAGASDRREAQNLLREAIHYAREDRIFMPFFLGRATVFPLLQELSGQTGGKNALPLEDMGLLKELLVICGKKAISSKTADTLSEREREVLRAMADGLTNKEIASKLCISSATVKTHVLNIFGKLGVSSRMMAAQEGQNRGLLC